MKSACSCPKTTSCPVQEDSKCLKRPSRRTAERRVLLDADLLVLSRSKTFLNPALSSVSVRPITRPYCQQQLNSEIIYFSDQVVSGVFDQRSIDLVSSDSFSPNICCSSRSVS